MFLELLACIESDFFCLGFYQFVFSLAEKCQIYSLFLSNFFMSALSAPLPAKTNNLIKRCEILRMGATKCVCVCGGAKSFTFDAS